MVKKEIMVSQEPMETVVAKAECNPEIEIQPLVAPVGLVQILQVLAVLAVKVVKVVMRDMLNGIMVF